MICLEQEILKAALQYKKLALSLSELDSERRLGRNIEPELQSALLAVYYAKKLEERVDKTAQLLTEDSSLDDAEAIDDAVYAIDVALEDAMARVYRYLNEEPEFAELVESLSVSSPSESLYTELLKLYKSESIISAAYSYAAAHSYSTVPEEFIMRHMDIDIDELLDIQQSLVDSIGNMLGDEQ